MTIMRRFGAMAGLATILSGCAAMEPGVSTPLAAGSAPTGARLSGHGAFSTPGGGHGSCAGFSVALSPDTPATRERMRILYGSTDHALAPVALVKRRAARAPRETADPLAGAARCDARGDFAFSGLSAGAYFLIARVKITPPRDGSDSFVIMRLLELTSGEADITLAP